MDDGYASITTAQLMARYSAQNTNQGYGPNGTNNSSSNFCDCCSGCCDCGCGCCDDECTACVGGLICLGVVGVIIAKIMGWF